MRSTIRCGMSRFARILAASALVLTLPLAGDAMFPAPSTAATDTFETAAPSSSTAESSPTESATATPSADTTTEATESPTPTEAATEDALSTDDGETESEDNETPESVQPQAFAAVGAAATGNPGCSYAKEGTGTYARTICWLNFEGFDSAGIEVTDKEVTINLSNGYTFTANLSVQADSSVTDSAKKTASLQVRAAKFPTWSGAFLGNTRNGKSFYTGVDGYPALYQYGDAGTSVVTLSNIKITRNSQIVSGYSIVVADAESSDGNEYIKWTTTGTDFMILSNTAAGTTQEAWMGNACGAGFTLSGKTAECRGQATSGGKSGTAMLVSGDPAGTTENGWSVSQTMKGAGLQGVAFGLQFATLEADITVNGRLIANDQFSVYLNSDLLGAPITVPTDGNDRNQTASTGVQSMVLPVGGKASVEVNAWSTNKNWSNDYVQSWVCVNSTNNGILYEGAVPPGKGVITVEAGDSVRCSVAFTAPTLTLVKSVKNTHKGTATATAWALTASRTGQSTPFTMTGKSGDYAITDVPVYVGTYALSESTSDTGYEKSYTKVGWSCVNGEGKTVSVTNSGDQTTVATTKGEAVTCTVTNQDLPGVLTVTKQDFLTKTALVGTQFQLWFDADGNKAFDSKKDTKVQEVATTSSEGVAN